MDKQSFSYRLLAQNRDGTLLIQISGQNKYLRKTAGEVMSDTKLLSGFPAVDAALIGVIVGMTSNEQSKNK